MANRANGCVLCDEHPQKQLHAKGTLLSNLTLAQNILAKGLVVLV